MATRRGRPRRFLEPSGTELDLVHQLEQKGLRDVTLKCRIEMVRLAMDDWSNKDIAKRVGIDAHYVGAFLSKSSEERCRILRGERAQGGRRKASPDQVRATYQLAAAGRRNIEIAETVGLSRWAVVRILKNTWLHEKVTRPGRR